MIGLFTLHHCGTLQHMLHIMLEYLVTISKRNDEYGYTMDYHDN